MTTPGGITLEPFSADNADLVLSWRNSDHVRANSLDDRPIARENHLAFVASLPNRPKVAFYVVSLDGVPQAVLNLDASKDRATWGCYLGGAGPVRPGLFPILILIAGHLGFDALGLEVLESDVVAANTAPQKMNGFLGIPQVGERADLRPNGDAVTVLEYRLTRADWPGVQARAAKLMTQAQRAMVASFAQGLAQA